MEGMGSNCLVAYGVSVWADEMESADGSATNWMYFKPLHT